MQVAALRGENGPASGEPAGAAGIGEVLADHQIAARPVGAEETGQQLRERGRGVRQVVLPGERRPSGVHGIANGAEQSAGVDVADGGRRSVEQPRRGDEVGGRLAEFAHEAAGAPLEGSDRPAVPAGRARRVRQMPGGLGRHGRDVCQCADGLHVVADPGQHGGEARRRLPERGLRASACVGGHAERRPGVVEQPRRERIRTLLEMIASRTQLTDGRPGRVVRVEPERHDGHNRDHESDAEPGAPPSLGAALGPSKSAADAVG